ncbi:MAG: hypothetical protein AABX33_08335 [Nanoarchaeota archaeon]
MKTILIFFIVFASIISSVFAATYGSGVYGNAQWGIGVVPDTGGSGSGGGGGGGGGSGSGGSGGGDGGGLPSTLVKTYFSVDRDLISMKILQGESKSSELKIKNTGNTNGIFSIEVKNLGKLVSVSDNLFELKPGETKTLALSIKVPDVQPPDIYSGNILIKSGDAEKNVIVIIRVEEKNPLFDIKIRVNENYKRVLSGQEVKFDIELIKFGTPLPVDAELYYAIKGLDGNTSNHKTETLAVTDVLFLTRRLEVSKNLYSGNYLVYGRILYSNQTATGSDLFEVVGLPPRINITGLGYNADVALILGVILLAALIVYTISRRLVAKGKRKKSKSKRLFKLRRNKLIKVFDKIKVYKTNLYKKPKKKKQPISGKGEDNQAKEEFKSMDESLLVAKEQPISGKGEDKQDKEEFKVLDESLLEAVMKEGSNFTNEDTYKYVVKLSEEGYNKDEIKRILINAGLDLIDIDNAIEEFLERKKH